MVSEDGAWLPKNKAAFFIETEIAKARHEERQRIVKLAEGMKTCDKECYKEHNCNVERIKDEVLTELLTKIKEKK